METKATNGVEIDESSFIYSRIHSNQEYVACLTDRTTLHL
eukprot:COSAG02_NODE_2365_length_9052_cov_11.510779_7_plen_40_part_00